MKKGLIALFSIVLCSSAMAKDRYVMAQIILNNNDTIVNPIVYKELFEFQDKIIMKNEDGSNRTILPLDAKCFYVLTGSADTLFFESNCGVKLGLADNIDESCYFLLKIRNGVVPLYYFAWKKLYSVGISMKTAYSPCYLTKYREDWVMMETNNYMDQFLKVTKPFKRISDEPTKQKIVELENQFRYNKYRFEDIPKGVDSLNAILGRKSQK